MITMRDLLAAERAAVEAALDKAGTINGAAKLLGTDRHALKRRIVKHNIRWPRPTTSPAASTAGAAPPS